MAITSSRNRLIYFRVSEEELSRFRSLAAMRGSRSLSDLAREAIENISEPEADNAARVPELMEKLDDLQNKVDSMNSRLEALSGWLTERGAIRKSQEEVKQA